MFGGTGGCYRLDSWILANIVQLGTQTFWGCTGYMECKGVREMRDADQASESKE